MSVSVAAIGADFEGRASNFAFIADSTSTHAVVTSSADTNLRFACNNSSSAICASASILRALAAL